MRLFSRRPRGITAKRKLQFERLETRTMLSLPAAAPDPPGFATAAEVDQLLRRAVAASSRTDAIIAVVDRNGTILGVNVEPGVSLTNPNNLDFAIDGAVAEARTAAFFANNGNPTSKAATSPTALTSRTIRQISQTTITQREVQSNPDISETDPTKQGPGFVAPIGLGGHFPADISHTPPVDLFEIEGTNRAVVAANGLPYNVNPADIPPGQTIPIPFSYGQQTQDPGTRERQQPRHRHAARRHSAVQKRRAGGRNRRIFPWPQWLRRLRAEFPIHQQEADRIAAHQCALGVVGRMDGLRRGRRQ